MCWSSDFSNEASIRGGWLEMYHHGKKTLQQILSADTSFIYTPSI